MILKLGVQISKNCILVFKIMGTAHNKNSTILIPAESVQKTMMRYIPPSMRLTSILGDPENYYGDELDKIDWRLQRF